MKVVINRCFGGFGLSHEALKHLGISEDDQYELERTDPRLVEAVEKLGKQASGSWSDLLVVEIPDDMPYYIDDYDGAETIHENHRIFPPR